MTPGMHHGERAREKDEGRLDAELTDSARALLREVAHMLRSPLGSIALMTETLREQGAALDEVQRERPLSIIYRAALGIAATASDLLTLTHGDGDGEEDVADFTDAEVIGSVADIVRPVAEARGGELTVSVADVRLVGRARTIRRVLLNLALRLALRSRDGDLELRAEPDDSDRVTFSVTSRDGDLHTEAQVDEILTILRTDGGGKEDGYTLSAEGLGVAAARRLISSMGSELRVEAGPENRVRLSFTVATGTR